MCRRASFWCDGVLACRHDYMEAGYVHIMAAEAGATLPPSIEDAGIPTYDLFGFRDPLALLVTYTDRANE
jgi:hypothetical protein